MSAITFARLFDSQVHQYGLTQEAVKETLQICRVQNILRDYLRAEEAANS